MLSDVLSSATVIMILAEVGFSASYWPSRTESSRVFSDVYYISMLSSLAVYG